MSREAHVQLCVQLRLACFSGRVKPTEAIVRTS